MTYAELLPDGMKAEMRRFVRGVAKHGIIDVVEVVRCKDCTQFMKVEFPNGLSEDEYWLPHFICFNFEQRWVQPNDYCAWGERREDGANR